MIYLQKYTNEYQMGSQYMTPHMIWRHMIWKTDITQQVDNKRRYGIIIYDTTYDLATYDLSIDIILKIDMWSDLHDSCMTMTPCVIRRHVIWKSDHVGVTSYMIIIYDLTLKSYMNLNIWSYVHQTYDHMPFLVCDTICGRTFKSCTELPWDGLLSTVHITN